MIVCIDLLLWFVLIFGLMSYGVSWLYTRNTGSGKDQFLVANRQLNFYESSFSIAATWIWAPALFVSAQKAFLDGWLGLFWFIVPNILCLLLFSVFAVKMRDKYPTGFTLSGCIAEKYTPRVQNIYWFTLSGLTICAFAVQLLAGGAVLASFLKIPYWVCTVIIALLPLAYSVVFGLRASIITDYVKMIVILVLGIGLVSVMISDVGLNTVIVGLAGMANNTDFWSAKHLTLFLTFGLPVTIGLMSGPFGDQSFWQRAFATKKEVVRKSFTLAAFIFGVVPLIMGLLGFIAVGSGVPIVNSGLVNLEIVTALLGKTGAIVFFFIVMSAITSILDSKLCAISSIAGHDIAERFNLPFKNTTTASMVIVTVLALAIANIPDLKLLYLFLFYGTLRASTFLPTIMMLLDKPLSERGVFYGVLSSLCIGLPVFVYGNLNGLPLWITGGSLLTVTMPVIVNLLLSSKSNA